jgi:hypothetical protein
MRHIFIPEGLHAYTALNVFSGQAPNQLFVGFNEVAAYQGSFSKNPFYFKVSFVLNVLIYGAVDVFSPMT